MTDPYRRGDRGADPVAPAGSDPVRTEPAIRQLDTMIENVANYAAPVLREIAARAAELAAKAGQAAGPIAHRAADKTEQVGGRLATKGREVASDLRQGSTGASGSGPGPVDDDRPGI
jgi:hypothetical protein